MQNCISVLNKQLTPRIKSENVDTLLKLISDTLCLLYMLILIINSFKNIPLFFCSFSVFDLIIFFFLPNHVHCEEAH